MKLTLFLAIETDTSIVFHQQQKDTIHQKGSIQYVIHNHLVISSLAPTPPFVSFIPSRKMKELQLKQKQ